MKIGVAGPITLRMLAPLFPPGTDLPETYSFPLIATLASQYHARGHEIAVFALSTEVEETQYFRGERIEAYVAQRRRPRWQMLDFWRGERAALAEAMKSSGCNVIHAHWTYEFAAAAVASGLPHVVTAHDIPMRVMRFARHPYWLEKPLLAWGVLRNARRVTAVSPYVANALRGFLRPRREVTVVCNGVGQNVFELHESWCRRKASDKVVFASILNGWSALKNGQQLVEAFALLRNEFGEKIELWMFGNGHEPGGPGNLWAEKRSSSQGIRFIGSLPYTKLMPMLAENVDVLVHPSLEESFGMTLAEAMAIGLPVIAGVESGATPWVLRGGSAGLLVDVRSSKSIANGMRRMVEDLHLRTSLAHSGNKLARSEYDIAKVVARYEEILSQASREQAH